MNCEAPSKPAGTNPVDGTRGYTLQQMRDGARLPVQRVSDKPPDPDEPIDAHITAEEVLENNGLANE